MCFSKKNVMIGIIIILCLASVIYYVITSIEKSSYRAEQKNSSNRIGNYLDAWYFGTLGSKERVREFTWHKKQQPEGSFASTIKLGEGVSYISPENKKKSIEHSDVWWCFYNYDCFAESPLLENLQNDIRKKLESYFSKDIKLPAKNDVVIHSRLGDFISQGVVMPHYFLLNALKDVCKENNIVPNNIYIMDGGTKHNANYDLQKKGKQYINELNALLNKNFPDSKVKEYNSNGNADLDFWYMANSPILITAAGAYAIAAAIANNNHVRTPALQNLNRVYETNEKKSQTIRPGWKTYDIDRDKMKLFNKKLKGN